MPTNEIIFDIDQEDGPILPRRDRYDDLTTMQRIIISTGIVRTTEGVQIILFGVILVVLAAIIFNELGGESPSAKYGNYEQYVTENPEFFE